jgi:peroxiredoxin
MKIKDIAIVAFAAALIGALAFLWVSPSGVKRSPDVAVTTLDGASLKLATLRGRPVLVTFWATTCPGCVAEMPHLVQLYRQFNPRGLGIVAIAMSYDPPKQVREMVRRRKLPYTVALDAEGAAAKAFGDVQLTPTTFLVAPDGRIVQQTLGELDMAKLRARIDAMLSPA